MHCDDKRTLYVLKEEIHRIWEVLKKSDFEDRDLINKMNESIQDYLEYKKEAT